MITLAANGADLLTHTIEPNGFIDFVRIMVAFLGLMHLLFALHRFAMRQVFWSGIAFMATGLLTMLHQMEALGDPLVPWRLPLYAVMNIAGITFIYKIGRRGHEDAAFS